MFPPLYIFNCIATCKNPSHEFWTWLLVSFLDRIVFWWVTSLWLPKLLCFEFTVWFSHKQYILSALFHHLHPWSQVCCRRAKKQSSHWRSQQESCPSCRCMSSSHLSVRLRPWNLNRWGPVPIQLPVQLYDLHYCCIRICHICIYSTS